MSCSRPGGSQLKNEERLVDFWRASFARPIDLTPLLYLHPDQL